VVGARQGAPQVRRGGKAMVVRQQAVGERGEDVAAAHGVVARPLLGRRGVVAVATGAVLEEHAGDAEGVDAEEHRFLPPQVAAGAVQLLDRDQCHRSERPDFLVRLIFVRLFLGSGGDRPRRRNTTSHGF